MKDFVVDITKLTKPMSQKGFGLPLILATSKEHPYTLYSDISDMAKDFEETTAEYKIAARILGQEPAPEQVAIYGVLYDDVTGKPEDLVAALNTLIGKNNDWYFLTCPESDDTVISALAAWTETQQKMYFVTTQSLMTSATMEYENTVVMYHDKPDAYVAEGLAAIGAVNQPGEITFKFKTVKGVSEATITATELEQLHTDGGFSYIRKMGILQTTEGITTSGEFADVVMGAHFIKARMEEEAAALAANTKKIPYDNQGIAMLVGIADSVLKQGVDQGIILRDDNDNGVYTITAKKREEVSINDVANRIYNGVRWEAKLAGAIHSGTISGVLTY